MRNFGIGVLLQFGTAWKVLNFFPSKSLHPTMQMLTFFKYSPTVVAGCGQYNPQPVAQHVGQALRWVRQQCLNTKSILLIISVVNPKLFLPDLASNV